ncbi:MAG: hypothetical protein AAFR11_00250 [Pseudomonadota bacterium]
MTKTIGLETGAYIAGDTREDEMFVGWAGAPGVDRRFLLWSTPLALAAVGGIGYAVASELDDPGAGVWDTATTHEVDGVLAMDPYPVLRTPDASAPGGVRTLLVMREQKCSRTLDFAGRTGRPVRAAGNRIQRKNRVALEVPLLKYDWISEPPAGFDAGAALQPPTPEPLGRATLRGMIMDSKCFFGVMKPARGKTHKACAALCIRGGIPPTFWVRTEEGAESLLLMTTAAGDAHGEDILPLVADPVEAAGEIVRVGDLLHFRADAGAYRPI